MGFGDKSGDIHAGAHPWKLEGVEGKLHHQFKTYPILIKEISKNACIVESKVRFRDGALQLVELDVHCPQENIQMFGETEWCQNDKLIGIILQRTNDATRQKVVDILSGQSKKTNAALDEAAAPEAKKETPPPTTTTSAPAENAVSPVPPPAAPAQAVDTVPDKRTVPAPAHRDEEPNKAGRLSTEFVCLVHQGAPRALCKQNHVWKADLMLIDSGIRISTTVLDISLRGCTLHVESEFGEECDSRAQLVLQLDGQRIAVPADPVMLEDGYTLGLRFVYLNNDRRHFLNKLILKMRNS